MRWEGRCVEMMMDRLLEETERRGYRVWRMRMICCV